MRLHTRMLRHQVSGSVTRQSSATYQADLAKIGVKLNIVKLEMAVWSDQVNGRKYKGLYYASSANLQLSPGSAYTGRPLNPDDNNEGFRTDAYASLVST